MKPQLILQMFHLCSWEVAAAATLLAIIVLLALRLVMRSMSPGRQDSELSM